jgi:phosphoribosyl 1,2-cyclic phosphodiesterase
MSLTITSFASGSSGNALLAQADGAAILIDCGIAMRTLERHLRYRGVEPAELRAIVLTHEHGDHAMTAGAFARRHKVPIVCNAPTHTAISAELTGLVVEELPVGEQASLGPFDLLSFPLAHDAAAPVGYRVSAGGATAALAIDLGSWDAAVVQALVGADLVIVEANHDRERLMASGYPPALRQRIYGPLGHLDNTQAGELLAHVCAAGGEREVWLAHLSQQTNSPTLAVSGVRRALSMAGRSCQHITALPRHTRPELRSAPVWHSDARSLLQQALF